jgi:hypothetical protein
MSSQNHLRVVGQFGVNEIDCLTEPSAVAPDAGVKLRTNQVAHHPRSFSNAVNWMNFSAGLRIVYDFSPKLTLASGATALGSVVGSDL